MKTKRLLKEVSLQFEIKLAVFFFCSFSISVAASDTISIAVGLNKPPYVIQAEDSGFEVEIIRSVFSKMGKQAKFNYVNYGRASKMLTMPNIDAVMTTNSNVFTDTTVLSDSYITYQNVAISLKENNFDITQISDLSHYSIASFQIAHKVLGPEFEDAALSSPLYVQIPQQKNQHVLLMKKRIDTLIMEKEIFKYFLRNSEWADQIDKIRFHAVFPVTYLNVAFKDKSNIEPFNQALKIFVKSAEYKELKLRFNID
ncbi:substrate-binding periplasmic protein [Paraglaciecola sp. 2405UD69-4]|uniref:substrate-binding periplasmic protein n=1 Tax=Paraglaciecola sp. 2405UD69-4 TaxID=3391836 RepID=UPI0039C8E580